MKKLAFSRFYRPDYFGDPAEPLADAIRNRMEQLTGQPVTGQVYGLMNMRTMGLYFSPVNFYYGYDSSGTFTHFLAEVSNIPGMNVISTRTMLPVMRLRLSTQNNFTYRHLIQSTSIIAGKSNPRMKPSQSNLEWMMSGAMFFKRFST